MRISLLIGLTALLLSQSVAAKETLVEIDTPRGVQQRFLLIAPEQPHAAVILFAGGKGALKLFKGMFGGPSMNWGKNNFLVRSRADFAKHGLLVATVDAPTDQQGGKGMLGGFRHSPAHVQDIDAVIGKIREIADVPIWLVGTSRGTESAAHLAIHSTQRPHGLVLTSSMTDSDAKGMAVTDMPLEQVRMPTLITHHKQDGCPKTRPEMADAIRDGLVNASPVELRWFSGGREKSRPCKAMSYHGYLGIEQEVVDAIAEFIKRH